jgi:hypothetical protein
LSHHLKQHPSILQLVNNSSPETITSWFQSSFLIIQLQQFWKWVVSKLEDELGDDLNYNRAIDIPGANEFVPNELREIKLRDVLRPEQDAKQKELLHYDVHIEGGMINDVSDYEDGIREEFQDIVDENADTEPIVKDIQKLLKKHKK